MLHVFFCSVCFVLCFACCLWSAQSGVGSVVCPALAVRSGGSYPRYFCAAAPYVHYAYTVYISCWFRVSHYFGCENVCTRGPVACLCSPSSVAVLKYPHRAQHHCFGLASALTLGVYVPWCTEEPHPYLWVVPSALSVGSMDSARGMTPPFAVGIVHVGPRRDGLGCGAGVSPTFWVRRCRRLLCEARFSCVAWSARHCESVCLFRGESRLRGLVKKYYIRPQSGYRSGVGSGLLCS